MKTKLIRIGNSRGVRIPASMLKETGLEGEVVLEAKGNHLEIHPAPPHPRAGWEEAARRMHEAGDDVLVLGDFPNAWDEEEWTWPESKPRRGSRSTTRSSNRRSGAKSGKRGRASSSRRTS